MSDRPYRDQRRRSSGYRLPEGTICVTRPGEWGNPFRVGEWVSVRSGESGAEEWLEVEITPALAVELFIAWAYQETGYIDRVVAELRGHNLACWCAEGEPCHADFLLTVANA